MKRLHHNGVLVPPAYEGKSFTIKLKGETFKLTPEQEDLAAVYRRLILAGSVSDNAEVSI